MEPGGDVAVGNRTF